MTVTNFIWDELSDNVLLETDESDVVTAAYHHRPEQFGELISQNRNGVDRFFHFDGKQSTSDLTASNEKVTDTFSFTAYGEEVARTGNTTNPFGYKGAVGYYTNESTSDIYVRNRSYEPSIGRWLSADPLGLIDGPNLYRAYFVPNGIDPTGQYAFCQNVETAPHRLNVCGECEAIMSFSFVATGPKEDIKKLNGWVVQKLVFHHDVRRFRCRFQRDGTRTYYEAFRVEEGQLFRGRPNEPMFADRFYLADWGSGSEGEHSVAGEVTYLPDLVVKNPPWRRPGDPEAPPTSPNDWTLKPGTPDGWKARKFSLNRALCATWYCCDYCHADVLTVPMGTTIPTDVSCSFGWDSICVPFDL